MLNRLLNRKFSNNIFYLNIYKNNDPIKYWINEGETLYDLENKIKEDNLAKYSVDFYDIQINENNDNLDLKEIEEKDILAIDYFKSFGGKINIDKKNIDYSFGNFYKIKNDIYLNNQNKLLQKILTNNLFNNFDKNLVNNEEINKDLLLNVLKENRIDNFYSLISKEKENIKIKLDKLLIFYKFYENINKNINSKNEQKSVTLLRSLWFLILLLNCYLFYLTYFVYGWDAIEPVSYLVTLFFEILGIFLFLRKRRFPSNQYFFNFFLKKNEVTNPKFKNIIFTIKNEIKENEKLLEILK